jgi:hypothetical protein
MAVQSNRVQAREHYARDTEVRMKQVVSELLSLEHADASGASRLTSQLRQQEEASKLAGYVGISRLCRQMEACLTEIQGGEPLQLPPTTATLLGVCRAIEMHATGNMKGK